MSDKRRSPFPLRLDEELERWAKEQAKKDDRSVNGFINRLLRQAKQSQESPHAQAA